MRLDFEYITFSKNIFIPVTNVCRNAYDYCVFKARSLEEAYVIDKKQFLEIITNKGSATEALFTAGETPELAIKRGLLPHCNSGVLSRAELKELRAVNASMGLMLETTSELEAYIKSPSKDPKLRLEMIKEAGRLKIPFTPMS